MNNILVVDDVSLNLVHIKNALGDSYDLTLVKSGAQAFQRLEYSEPDLIILDILMPEMNGFEVFQKIRNEYPDKKFPVLFLTAVDDKDKIIKIARNEGVIGYMLKPYKIEDLVSRVNEFFFNMKKQENTED